MTIIDVTKRFIEFYNYLVNEKKVKNAADFANKTELSRSIITEITKGRTNCGVKIIQNTVQKFPELDLYWLITGRGEMLKVPGRGSADSEVEIVGQGNIVDPGNKAETEIARILSENSDSTKVIIELLTSEISKLRTELGKKDLSDSNTG